MSSWAMWFLAGLAILVALPIIVRLRTGKWGNGKSFGETYSAVANLPQHKEGRRLGRYKALGVLLFGFPLACVTIWLSQRMGYSAKEFMPVVTVVMLGAATLFGAFLYRRASSTNTEPR